MAKAQIIKEDSVQRLKQFMHDNIERIDAEIIILEAESNQEKCHKQNEQVLIGMSNRSRCCYTEREVFHSCLCEIQRNITEIEI